MSKGKKISLKRDISLYLLVFYGLGNILGAGIYVLIGKISALAGMFTPLSFLLACFIVLFTALSYAELSARFPKSAGEALYAKKAFHSKYLSLFIGLLIALSGILSSATIVHGFYGYLSNFYILPKSFVSVLLIAILCAIAVAGIGKSVKVAALLTLLEILGLLIIIYTGVAHIEFEDVHIASYLPGFELKVWHAISLGAFLAFYAFIGFEDMVNVAEEVKNPTNNMPKAIVISVVIATLLYISVAVISIIAIEPQTLAKSEAPLADVFQSLSQKEPIVLSYIGMFAVINGALIQIIMVSRLLYGMSVNKWIPAMFSSVNEKTRTPVFSTVFTSCIVLVFTLWLPIVTLASLTSFFIFIIFTFMNVALIKIKKEHVTPEGIRTFPLWVPIVGTVVNVGLLVIQVFSVLQ